MILYADKDSFVSALHEENEVGWIAASLRQPQGAMGVAEQGCASPAWTP